MNFNRKIIVILLILIGTFIIIGGVCAQQSTDSLSKSTNVAKKVKVKIK